MTHTMRDDRRWIFILNEVKSFYRFNGYWPKQKTIVKGLRLGDWIREQKRRYRSGKLLRDRYIKLLDIGIKFEIVDYKVPKMKDKYIKPSEYVYTKMACKLLKCSKNTLRNGVINIPNNRDPVNGYRRYKLKDIEEYLQNN